MAETWSCIQVYIKFHLHLASITPQFYVSRDTFSLLKNPVTFEKIIDIFCDLITQSKADVVVGLEARGFTLGGAVCYKLKLPFVPVRKKNKLPGALKTVHYTLEYGEVSRFQERR